MTDPAGTNLPRTPTSWSDVPSFSVAPARATVIFDGSCDFCTRSVRFVRWLDRRRRLTIVPFQKPGVPAAHGLTVADCERAAWTVTPDGRRYPGAAAVNVALAVALGTRLPWVLYRLPGIRQLQDLIYALVARNRTRLPGDTPYCEQHPDACR
jgi:predicted DCC family thiol-disulfide oxidoreductase YuxK